MQRITNLFCCNQRPSSEENPGASRCKTVAKVAFVALTLFSALFSYHLLTAPKDPYSPQLGTSPPLPLSGCQYEYPLSFRVNDRVDPLDRAILSCMDTEVHLQNFKTLLDLILPIPDVAKRDQSLLLLFSFYIDSPKAADGDFALEDTDPFGTLLDNFSSEKYRRKALALAVKSLSENGLPWEASQLLTKYKWNFPLQIEKGGIDPAEAIAKAYFKIDPDKATAFMVQMQDSSKRDALLFQFIENNCEKQRFDQAKDLIPLFVSGAAQKKAVHKIVEYLFPGQGEEYLDSLEKYSIGSDPWIWLSILKKYAAEGDIEKTLLLFNQFEPNSRIRALAGEEVIVAFHPEPPCFSIFTELQKDFPEIAASALSRIRFSV